MSLSTLEAIREEFRTATREQLMKRLRHDVDWDRFQAIEREAFERTAQEKKDWNNNYDSRLAEARQIILRETHGNILEPPKPNGMDAVPDRDALDNRADERIRRDHQRRLAVIKKDELDQYQALQSSLDGRDRLKGYTKNEFEQVRHQTRSRAGPSRN